MFATVYEKPEFMPPTGPFGHVWDVNIHFAVSHDFFASKHSKVVACGNMFEIISKKVFLAMPSACPTGIDGQPRTVPKVCQSLFAYSYLAAFTHCDMKHGIAVGGL